MVPSWFSRTASPATGFAPAAWTPPNTALWLPMAKALPVNAGRQSTGAGDTAVVPSGAMTPKPTRS